MTNEMRETFDKLPALVEKVRKCLSPSSSEIGKNVPSHLPSPPPSMFSQNLSRVIGATFSTDRPFYKPVLSD
jgi:hypothetical protein